MKLFAVTMIAALALGGCTVPIDDNKLANQECRSAPDLPAWDTCITRYISRMEARKTREAARSRARDDAFDDAVGAAILANYATRPRSCMNIGGIVTC